MYRSLLTLAAGIVFLTATIRAQPLIDYHQHLFSPVIAALNPGGLTPLGAAELIALLDKAGIRRALVLSVAYLFGNPNRPPVENEYEKVQAENDWTSRQVALYPTRLRGFCGVNPLKDYALQEIARCAKDPQLRAGLKLHFGNSDVDLDNAAHVTQLRRVFEAANRNGMAIAVHMHASVNQKRPYGAKEARVFLTQVIPSAPDVPIQIAHLTGAGGYDDDTVDKAVSVFTDAIARGDARTKRLYFDASGIAGYGAWEKKAELIAKRIRQLGVARVLYGSDGAGGGNLAPQQAWAAFRKLPLSAAEFQVIERNLAPYMR